MITKGPSFCDLIYKVFWLINMKKGCEKLAKLTNFEHEGDEEEGEEDDGRAHQAHVQVQLWTHPPGTLSHRC
jgi:hypothetical protein